MEASLLGARVHLYLFRRAVGLSNRRAVPGVRATRSAPRLTPRYIGYLATHEGYFLGFDTLPLWLGIVAYMIFWPGAFVPSIRKSKKNAAAPSEAGRSGDVEMVLGTLEGEEGRQSGRESVKSAIDVRPREGQEDVV